MKTARFLALLAVVSLFCFFGGCKKADNKKSGSTQASALPPQSPEELGLLVAQIDDMKITIADFQERLNQQSPYIRARYTSLERKKEFLDNLIRFEVLAKEAKRRGMDRDPEVVRTMKQVMIQKLMKDEFETRVKPDDVTDDEMKKFFEEHKNEYNKPEEVRVSAIVVKEKPAAEKATAEAKGQKGTDNKGFRDLVTKYSQDEDSKQRGGDLRYFTADTAELPAEVVKASFALAKSGDVAGPIGTSKGFYVLKQTGRRQAMVKAFDEVKAQIKNRIYRDKRTKSMEDFVAGLKTAAKIVVNDDKLAQVRVDTTAAGTPERSGGGDEGGDPHGGLPIPPAPTSVPPVPGAPPAPSAAPAAGHP